MFRMCPLGVLPVDKSLIVLWFAALMVETSVNLRLFHAND